MNHLRSSTMFGLGLLLAMPVVSVAVMVEDFVAVRILEPPDVHPPPDCLDFLPGNHECGAGPGFAGGISNDGDVIGILETDFRHRNSLHDTGRWLRSNDYQGENMRRMVLAGAGPGGLAYGLLRVRKVTSGGFAWAAGNPGLVRYDISDDEWKYFGRACAGGGNNQGRGVANECKSPDADEYARVVDAKLIGDEPFTGEERGDLQRLDSGLQPHDINNDDIIIGSLNGNPLKILPDGVDHWGEPIPMDEFVGFAESDVFRISDSDPPYAIGFSIALSGKKGIVWNVTTGEMVADMGTFTELHTINSSGTMIVGLRAGFGFPAPPPEHLIWWSDDGWKTFQEINANDILDVAPGGEHIAAITKLTGVNDHGQISAQGLIKGEFGQYVTPGISAWDPAVATDPTCPNSDPGEWRPGNGCGIPLLLDTIALGPVDLKGDVNNDAIVDFLDITPFINAQSAEGEEDAFLLLTPNGCFLCADIDMDGAVDFLDITPFVNLLDEVAGAVPEPTSLVVLAMIMLRPRRRRKR